jgi:hypothetical protein
MEGDGHSRAYLIHRILSLHGPMKDFEILDIKNLRKTMRVGYLDPIAGHLKQ